MNRIYTHKRHVLTFPLLRRWSNLVIKCVSIIKLRENNQLYNSINKNLVQIRTRKIIDCNNWLIKKVPLNTKAMKPFV